MNLPLIHSQNKGKAILIGYVIFCIFYLVPDKFHFYPSVQLNDSVVDQQVPFMPWSICIYLSQIFFLFLALWKCENNFKRTIVYYAMLLAIMIASMIFFVVPTELPRQEIQGQGLLAFLWYGLYLTDTPANCFPSLHVALSLMAAHALASVSKLWQWSASLWALLICISTLTTKQHYAIDVLGGVVLAAISVCIMHFAFKANSNYENAYQSN